MKVKMKIKSRLRWCRIPPNVDYYNLHQEIEELQAHENYLDSKFRKYKTEKFTLKVNNKGDVVFEYNDNVADDEIRKYAQLLLGFIALCTDTIIEYDKLISIDEKMPLEFFSYPTADKLNMVVAQDIKYMEISMEEIDSEFCRILNNLLDMDEEYLTTLLGIFMCDLYYKDFIGNGIHKFKNSVGLVESIMSIINKGYYDNKYNENKIKFTENEQYKNLKKYVLPKGVSLESKLMDAIDAICSILDCSPVSDYKSKCNSVANNRNLYSHYFSKKEKANYLSAKEMQEFQLCLRAMFRIIMLKYLGVDIELLRKNFKENDLMRANLSKLICFG